MASTASAVSIHQAALMRESYPIGCWLARLPISDSGFVFAAVRCSRTQVRSASVLAKASPESELGRRIDQRASAAGRAGAARARLRASWNHAARLWHEQITI